MPAKISETNQGHRHRLRKRFLEQGLEGFEDHNILELLLFYAIPIRDTNKLAHDIMNHFGNDIEKVFDADYEEICKVDGVGENVATLIKLMPSISKFYLNLKQKPKAVFTNIEDVADFIKSQYLFDKVETFALLSLDSTGRFLGFDKMSSGTSNITEVNIIKVIENAIKNNASCVIIAHNHPSGNLTPSVSDVSATRRLCDAFETINIHVMDHVIVSQDGYTSMANSSQYSSLFKY